MGQPGSAAAPLRQYITGGSTAGAYAPINLSIDRYGYNSPVRNTDPTGHIPIDTVWDALNIVYDAGKIGVGYATGNAAMMAEGTADLAMDAAAMARSATCRQARRRPRVFGKVATKAADAEYRKLTGAKPEGNIRP